MALPFPQGEAGPAGRQSANVDGLASTAQAELSLAPNAGVMLVFWSKRGDRVKVLFRVCHGCVFHAKVGSHSTGSWASLTDNQMA